MPRNIEIKARVESFSEIRRRTEFIADEGPIEIHQLDTFFHSNSGRLKLREFGDGSGELIYYRRPDQAGPKESIFSVLPVSDPGKLKSILEASNGVKGLVRKRRLLYLIGQTRLHLDTVEGLGDFLELEVVLREEQSAREGENIAEALMSKLEISGTQLIEEAYIDLLQKEGRRMSKQDGPDHFFLRWTLDTFPVLEGSGIDELLLEVCSDGFVTREIGIGGSGEIIHRAPSAAQPYCLAGGEAIETRGAVEGPSAEEFEELWGRE